MSAPEPAIHRAARLGDGAELERLVAAGGDVNARWDLEDDHGPYLKGLTPLLVAAGSYDGASVATLAWLLQHGADPRATSDARVTAVWYAAGRGMRIDDRPPPPDHVDRLRFLLDSGVDVGLETSWGTRLLAEACGSGDPLRVRLLLERGASPDDRSPPRSPMPRRTTFDIPLFRAAMSGSADCVDLILRAGANADERDRDGRTALMHAASADSARRLVDGGADVLAEDRQCDDVLDVILEGWGCYRRDGCARLSVASVLLAAGAPLDRGKHSRTSRLWRAAFHRDVEAVDFLLSLGCVPRPDSDGETPLHGACWHTEDPDEQMNVACERVIRTLVGAGNPVDARDDRGRTPFDSAYYGDGTNETAIRTLLALGATPTVPWPAPRRP